MPRVCATMPLHNQLASASEAYRDNRRRIEAFTTTMRRARTARRTEPVRIPVVVHVLHNSPAHDVSDAQIAAQIHTLNEDFRMRNADIVKTPDVFRVVAADALIEFALAVRDPAEHPTNGIHRVQTPVQTFRPDTNNLDTEIMELDQKIKFAARGGADAWPRDEYLNLWVCDFDGNGPGQILGYAAFPGFPAATDGVVIWYKAFGQGGSAAAPFDLGRTATHEIGHWLNLLHIWGDDGLGCFGSDNVEDTPNQAGYNEGEPAHPKTSCGNTGDMFMNYMDYSDDVAMHMFTAGQVERMAAALNGPRAAILSSEGLTPPAGIARIQLPELAAAVGSPPSAREAGTAVTKVFDGVTWV